MTTQQKELLEKTNKELKKISGDCRLTLAVLSYALNKYLELENKVLKIDFADIRMEKK